MVTILLEQILELLKGWLSSFTTWAEGVATNLGLIEEATEYIDDIYDDTEAIKTDTGNIATSNQLIVSNTQGINNRLQSIDPNVTAIKNNVGTISTNTGIAAAFSEDIATNTMNTLNKVTTIASDTTQLRSNSNAITADVSDIRSMLNYFSYGLIVTEDVEGALCSFDTDLIDYLQNLNITIDPDSNGISSVNITRSGKNLFNDAIYTECGWTLQENGYYNGNAQALLKNSRYAYTNGGIKTNGVVTISFDLIKTSGNMQIYVLMEDNQGVWSNISGNIATGGHKTFITPSGKNCIAVGFSTTVGPSSQAFSLKNFQVEISTNETEYEAYKSNTYNVSLGSTVTDGGDLNALTGVLKVNTTPPSYSVVDPITVKTFKGINNIWADTGNSMVTYKETLKHKIDKEA